MYSPTERQDLKKKERQHFRALRAAIDKMTRQKAGEQSALHFSTHPLFLRSHQIACYLPLTEEFDSRPLIKSIWQAQKTCFLPIIHPPALSFVAYESHHDLTPNQFGIFEVVGGKSFSITQLDLMILPLVAFDLKGHRLGMGGGFYDRTLASVPLTQRPLLLGLGYQIQEAQKIPVNEFDIPLDGVITENRVLIFKR